MKFESKYEDFHSFKMHLKKSYAKWRSFCLGLNVFIFFCIKSRGWYQLNICQVLSKSTPARYKTGLWQVFDMGNWLIAALPSQLAIFHTFLHQHYGNKWQNNFCSVVWYCWKCNHVWLYLFLSIVKGSRLAGLLCTFMGASCQVGSGDPLVLRYTT